MKGRAIQSLEELKPGDHIYALEGQTRQGSKSWYQPLLEWFSSSSMSLSQSSVQSGSVASSQSASASASRSGSGSSSGGSRRHMLVVEVKGTDKVHVIYMTENGVKETAMPLKPEDVEVIEHKRRLSGEKAIEKARSLCGEKGISDEKFVTKAVTDSEVVSDDDDGEECASSYRP